MSRIDGSVGPVAVPEAESEAASKPTKGKGNTTVVEKPTTRLDRLRRLAGKQPKDLAIRERITQVLPHGKVKPKLKRLPPDVPPKPAATTKTKPESRSTEPARKSGSHTDQTARADSGHSVQSRAKKFIAGWKRLLEGHSQKTAALATATREQRETDFKALVKKFTSGAETLTPDQATQLKQALSKACLQQGFADFTGDREFKLLMEKHTSRSPDASSSSSPTQTTSTVLKGAAELAPASKAPIDIPAIPEHLQDISLPEDREASPCYGSRQLSRLFKKAGLPSGLKKPIVNARKSKDVLEASKHMSAYLAGIEQHIKQKGVQFTDEQKRVLYLGMVSMGTHLLILQTPPTELEPVPGKPQRKKKLALLAYDLMQVQDASSKPARGMLKGQADQILQTGVRLASQKELLYEGCFNIKLNSTLERSYELADHIRKDGELAKALLRAEPGSKEEQDLKERIENRRPIRQELERQLDELKAVKEKGMVEMDDLYGDCYEGFKQYLQKKMKRKHRLYLKKAITPLARDKLKSTDAIVDKASEIVDSRAEDFARSQHGGIKGVGKGASMEAVTQLRKAELEDGMKAILAAVIESKS